MKIRPQKHVRQGFSGKSKLQRRSNQPKTRKEIRKEKRQQKKINRFNYHSRKRTDRFPQEDSQPKKGKREADSEEEEDEFDDEEIESEFEDEVEQTLQKKKTGRPLSQMEKERQEELKELENYEQGLKDKRIEQLEAANEEDDLIIKKYEKLLKINRRKNKQGVPKSFNDGLDYALELCTEENIRKMYDAAKEAAHLDEHSEDEFADDVQEVLGKKVRGEKRSKKLESTKNGKKSRQEKEKQRMENLKEIEKKYLGDDELDSLGGYDSEIEEADIDQSAEEDYSDNDELYDSDKEGMNESDEDEVEQEAVTEKGKSKKVTFQIEDVSSKAKKAKKFVSEPEPEEDSDFDEDVFGGDDEDDGLDDLMKEIDSDDENNIEGPNKTTVGEDSEKPGVWEDIYGRKRDKGGPTFEII